MRTDADSNVNTNSYSDLGADAEEDADADPNLIFPFPSSEEPDVFIAERLFSSSLVAVVAAASPRTLRIEHFKKVLPELHLGCLPHLTE